MGVTDMASMLHRYASHADDRRAPGLHLDSTEAVGIIILACRRCSTVRGRMREIASDFLLHVAEVSASLLGLFFVGIFLYVQTALGRGRERLVEAPYIRSSAQV